MRRQTLLLLFVLLLSVWSFGFQTAPEGTDIGPIIGLIMARALQLTTITKVVVDGVLKGLLGAEGNKIILAACAFAVLLDFGVLAIGQGAAGFTVQNSVMAIIAGIVGGIGSKVLTSVHDTVHDNPK